MSLQALRPHPAAGATTRRSSRQSALTRELILVDLRTALQREMDGCFAGGRHSRKRDCAGRPTRAVLQTYRGWLAASSFWIDSASNSISAASTSSANWSKFVALAIGAVTLGRAISHARAICPGLAS
jgi:hypothetical protein